MATVNNLSKGLVLWTKGDTATFKVRSNTNTIIISNTSEPSVALLTITPSAKDADDMVVLPKLYDAYFNSTDRTEKYSGKEITVTSADTSQSITSTHALMIVPGNSNTLKITTTIVNVNTELTITQATSMKFVGEASNITIDNGGLFVLGGCNVQLSSNGLKLNPKGDDGKMYIDNDCHYNTSNGVSNTNCGTGTLVINDGITLKIDSGSTLHVGSYQHGDGVLSVQQNFNLINSNLNIGATNNKNTTNTVTVSGSSDIVVSGSIINVGGSNGIGSDNYGGAGGSGTLTLSSSITNSKIFVGSGGGSRGESGGAGTGGSGTLTVSSSIENSIIFLGGAGGNGSMGSNPGAGGSGDLSVFSSITNSIIFVGSSGGGGSGSGGESGGAGGGAGGSGNNNGKAGGSGTLTVSGATNQITNKIVSFGLPSASDADIIQKIKTGPISNSVVFVGCGNYGTAGAGLDAGAAGAGSGGGASIALDYYKHGYISQRMIMSFRGMTPGVLTLPNGTSFPYIGEFPRADCSEWATKSETDVDIYDFIPPIVDKRTITTYNSPPCFVEPVSGFNFSNPSFNAIIINPNGSKVSSQFGAGITTEGKQLGISEQSILYQSDTINNGDSNNDVKKFIAIFNGEPTDGSRSYYQTFDLTNLKVNDEVGLSETNPAKITVKKQCALTFSASGDTMCSICASGDTLTLNGEGIKQFKAVKFNSTTIENEQTIKIGGNNEIDCSNLYIKDINHIFDIRDGCTFAVGSEISRTSEATGNSYSTVILSGTSISSSGKIILGDVIGGSGFNGIMFENSTINSTLSIDSDTSDTTATTEEYIRNTVINTPLKTSLAQNDRINYLTFSKGSFSSNSDGTQTDSALTSTFTLTEGTTPISLSNSIIKSGSTVNYGSAAFGASNVNIQGQYDVDVRNRLSMSSGVTLPLNSSLTVDNTLAANSEVSIGKDGLLSISNTSVEGLTIGDDVTFELNGSYNYANITSENGLIKYLGSGATNDSTKTSVKFLQGNVFINTLGYLNGSSLTYDSTMNFKTTQLNLFDEYDNPIQIEISDNTIKNTSEHPIVFSKPFSINSITVTPDETNTLTISGNSSVRFNISHNLTLSSAMTIEGNYILFDESIITSSGDYSQFNLKTDNTQTTFKDIDLENNSKKLIVKGDLKINQTTFFKLGSDVIIPEGTTLIFDVPKDSNDDLQDAYFMLQGQPTFIGSNIITLHSSSPGTSENPIVFDFSPSAQRSITVTSGITFVNSNITFIDSVINSGEAEFVNSSGSFKDFTNNSSGIFRMSYSKIADDKYLQIDNNGVTAWYNSEINPLDNGLLTIIKGSSMCPSMSDADTLTKTTLTFNGSFTVGTLNIAPKGSLAIYGQSSQATTFEGSLQINNDVYLGNSSQGISPIHSNNASTTLIMNTSKYDSGHALLGQIFMDAQTDCSATLQINSSGRITMPMSGVFKVTGYKESQRVVVNGTFKSSVEDSVYEYQKDMTLNGTIEMEHSAIIKGNLQITSSGKLLIGNVMAPGDTVPTVIGSDIVKESVKDDSNAVIGKKYTITFQEGSNYAKTIITDITEGEASTTASYEGTGIAPLRAVTRDDSTTSENITYTWEYSNGLLAILTVPVEGSDESVTFSPPTGMSLGNVFFGDSSDVYISDNFNIFGTFYNNGKLTVNARLLLSATASVINDGEIAVKGGNDNTIIGTVEIGNLGHLIFNGTYRDHKDFRLVINERGTLTVNDSLTITKNTEEMIISALTDPQKCNVLINGDIKTSPTIVSYDIAPKRDDKRESVYISINVSSDLDGYNSE